MSSEKQSVFFGTFRSYDGWKITLDEVPQLESLPVVEPPEVEATPPLAGTHDRNQSRQFKLGQSLRLGIRRLSTNQ